MTLFCLFLPESILHCLQNHHVLLQLRVVSLVYHMVQLVHYVVHLQLHMVSCFHSSKMCCMLLNTTRLISHLFSDEVAGISVQLKQVIAKIWSLG